MLSMDGIVNMEKEFFTQTRLLPTDINLQTITEFDLIHLKDNKPSFFIIIIDFKNDRIIAKKMIKIIQKAYYRARISVIYSTDVNVVKLYRRARMYNIHLFTPYYDGYSFKFKMFDICQFCRNGFDSVDQVNTWNPRHGFRYEFKLEKSFKGNFHKKTIRMGLYPRAITQHGHRKNYEHLARMLNLKWKFVAPKDHHLFNPFSIMLKNNKADLLGPGWVMNIKQSKPWLDSSIPYTESDGFRIVSVKPRKGFDANALFTAFDGWSWALIIGTLPVCAAVLDLIRRVTRVPDRPANFWNSLWDLTTILCFDCVQIRNPPLPVIILVGSYMFAVYNLIPLYFGVYASLVVVQRYERPPIDSTMDFLKSNMTVVFGSNGRRNLLAGSLPGIDDTRIKLIPTETRNFLMHEMREVMKYPDDLVLITTKEKAMAHLIHDENHIKHVKTNGREFYYSRDTIQNRYITFIYSRNSYMKEIINRKLALLQATGIRNKEKPAVNPTTLRKYGLRLAEEADLTKEDDFLKLKHLKLWFVFLCTIYILSAISLILEIFGDYMKRRKERAEKKISDGNVREKVTQMKSCLSKKISDGNVREKETQMKSCLSKKKADGKVREMKIEMELSRKHKIPDDKVHETVNETEPKINVQENVTKEEMKFVLAGKKNQNTPEKEIKNHIEIEDLD